MRKGYLTVYLSLILTVILSLVLTLVEGARISATKMRLECAADVAMNSVLAEYNKEMLEQYDLLFVDLGYGGNSPSIQNAQGHMQSYFQQNINVEQNGLFIRPRSFLNLSMSKGVILSYAVATDDNAEILKRQIADYMETTLVGIAEGWLGDGLEAGLELFENYGILSGEIFSLRDEAEAELANIEPIEIDDGNGNKKTVTLDNPADAANSTRSIGVLPLVKGNHEISTIVIAPEQYVSHRTRNQGDGVCDEEKDVGGPCNYLQLHSYIFDKCGYWGNLKEDSLLQYEIEYLIKGEDSDWNNLEKVCRTLLLWREAANALYLMNDSGKMAIIKAMATALAIIAFLPALIEPLTISILFAWAYLESLQDIKTLLNGGRVPLMKSAEDWKTGLASIVNIRESLFDETSENGLSYKDYLSVMLFLNNHNTNLWRLMDVMEMDVRKTDGNAYFKLDYCMHSFEAEFSVLSSFGPTANIKRRYGYFYAH